MAKAVDGPAVRPKTDCVWDCLADEVVLCVFHALLSSPGQAVPKVPSLGEAVCAGDNELRALCSVSATCRRWAALARDDGLWRRLLFLHRGQPLTAADPVEGLDNDAQGPPPPLAWLGRCLMARWPASPARSVQARVSGLLGLVEFTVGRVHTPLDGPPQAEPWLYRWPKYGGARVDDEWRRTQSSIACPEPFASWKACYAWHARWLDRELAHLWEGRPPNMRCLVLLCLMAQEAFNREPNVLLLSSPITVAAGPRGQFVDLIKLMRLVCKEPPATKYLFLGGYTERGGTGLQCFLLLLALKVKYPDHVYLLRGGKDNAPMSRIYGLYDECKRVYGGVQSWKLLVSTFQCLPLAAVIDDRTFCVHHGMSPTLPTLQDMDALARNELAEDEAPLCDLLFSEPQDSPWWAPNEDLLGCLWGPDVTEWWNRNNGLEFLVRSGGYIAEGYEKKHGGRVISLCSAPDWCGTLKNPGAVLLIDRSSMRILLFEAASDRMRSLPLRSEDLHLAVGHGEALPTDLHCAELSPTCAEKRPIVQ